MKTRAFLALAALALPLTACLTHPDPPAAPYHAVGTEPFWDLLIDEKNLTFRVMDGPLVTQPAVRPISGVAGDVYQTPRINVNVVHATCNDGMSDRVFPDTVEVTVDEKLFKGCGGL